jgi:hypothetical protein
MAPGAWPRKIHNGRVRDEKMRSACGRAVQSGDDATPGSRRTTQARSHGSPAPKTTAGGDRRGRDDPATSRSRPVRRRPRTSRRRPPRTFRRRAHRAGRRDRRRAPHRAATASSSSMISISVHSATPRNDSRTRRAWRGATSSRNEEAIGVSRLRHRTLIRQASHGRGPIFVLERRTAPKGRRRESVTLAYELHRLTEATTWR